MNAKFLFNNETENVSRYLSKAARWIDVIRNGNVYEDEDCVMVAAMSTEEQRKIINYVYAVMEPTIKELVTYSTNVWKMYDISDDFYNQAAMEVFENFHRFNNPVYGHEGKSHAFEYSCAVKPQFREIGNRLTGTWEPPYVSLLTHVFV